ncbi:sulfotransferase family 2 domain-containing protein [Neoroseomonas lacus]|uniref:Sulfotransferase family protein n=1 Tax=Neoroseomonas lacus TaxID=287609 RepID=A0A917NUA7_9PROT|nr:sulfotransferase family 2 domain-containing protein [Neoroseomonas lacus]GGJ28841.1 hypothetical protein GCM10011320_40110 [Neoroseomonas lacus]
MSNTDTVKETENDILPVPRAEAAKGGAQAADTRPIFFLHIPKTGGNTVVSHFLSFLPVESVFPPPPQLTLMDPDFAPARARMPSLAFLHGHLRVPVQRLMPPEDLRIATFIRHPVRRVASHYLYFRYRTELPMHHVAKQLSIAEFLRHYPLYIDNPQSRYLAQALGRRGADPRQGVELGATLIEDLDFVGVTERMQESLDAMSEHYGAPSFPAQRLNEGQASRDEIEACEAVLRRDEWLMRLNADFSLRQAAEEWLDRWQSNRRAARASADLLAGLRGIGPKPWVLSQIEDAGITFHEGWYAQGWVGEARSENQYWWSSASPSLLVASASGRPVTVRMHVLETMKFDAARIRVMIGDHTVKVEAALLNPGVELNFHVDAETFKQHGNAVLVRLIGPNGPNTSTFAAIDPTSNDHRPRSFAVRSITLLPA